MAYEMNKTKISIIIPFYTSTRGILGKAVLSVLAQTIRDIEVLVIDDNSPVDAKEELKDISDIRIKIIKLDTNKGGGLARTIGISNAIGEYISFLDYDDIWYPYKLERQLNFFEEINDDKVVLYSKCKIIESRRSFVRPDRAKSNDETVGEYLFCNNGLIQTSGIFLKRDILDKVKFHALKRHQDYQFCLSLEKNGAKFFLGKEVLYEFIQIPKLNDYNFSLKWLDEYSSYLNQRAIKGFKRNVIVRSMIKHGHYIRAIRYSYKEKLLISCLGIFSKITIKRSLTMLGLLR